MSGYREVPNSVSFPQLERQVLERWTEERTFARSLERRARAGAPRFVCYDGPPFATGLPHYGHILTSFIKDVVPRYQTMRGYHVPRRWGWDCHGLPVELEAEKALGLGSRAQVLAHGVAAFNQTCRALVTRYQAEWERIIVRLGRWVDFEGGYRTMDPDFVESVVWCFRALHDRGLIYEGQKVVAYCPRCQTALSNFEARIDDAYRPRDDLAVTVRFRLTDVPDQWLLAWTTTPWTLPANVALAVHPALVYVRLQKQGDSVWLAAEARDRFAAELQGWTEVERAPGTRLVGRTYRPAFPWFPGAFRVLAADFVTSAEGTGVVHLAPAFGEDDQAVCAEHGISGPNPVGDDGCFDQRVPPLAGLSVFAANEVIARSLAADGALFRREIHRHAYPHCWRCDHPLLYRAIPAWFVKVTAFKDRLAELSRGIRWVPAHVGEGRMADWLANARDWAVSRSRFWGAPVPVWRCSGCDRTQVVGGAAELERLSGNRVTDWHRPHIDEVVFPCAACSATMRRVPEVLDCWFESGAMPVAQVHYPFAEPGAWGQRFPGDFVVEYIAQTRGWFYTTLVLAAALFDAPPFRAAVCHGVILGADGRKMSKRLRNYPDPMELVDEHGADALRAALLSSGAVSGLDIRFSPASVRDAVRRLHLPLWNVLHLHTAYATIDGFVPGDDAPVDPGRLDRYLLGEADLLREAVEAAMAGYDFAAAYRAIEEFVVLLSTFYLRLVKPLLWRSGLSADKRAAYQTLHIALGQLAKVAAPFLPFLAESVHGALGGEGSVHLQDWPRPRPEWQDERLLEEMRALRGVVRLARRVREENRVKHRQPLRLARVAGVPAGLLEQNRAVLLSELNVKQVAPLADAAQVVRREVVLDYAKLGKRLRGEVKAVARAVSEGRVEQRAGGRLEAAGQLLEPDEHSYRLLPRDAGQGVAAHGDLIVVLDLATDPALVREGYVREVNRAVQDLRKRARLAYDDRAVVSLLAGGELAEALREHEDWLRREALAVAVWHTPLPRPLVEDTVSIAGAEVKIALARA
jgi:isoleucyl-tRNA synthetase